MNEKVTGGVALAVIAVVLILIFNHNGNQSSAGCELSGPAAAALVDGVSEGDTAEKLVKAGVAGVAVPAVCKDVVNTLETHPSQAVTLTTPAATQSIVGNQVSSGCSNAQSQFIRSVCQDLAR